MSCIAPWKMRVKNRFGQLSAQKYDISCRYCQGCRLSRIAQWQDRVEIESQYYRHFSFITLTYDDFHLPFGLPGMSIKEAINAGYKPSTRNEHVTKFFYNVRYRVNKDPKTYAPFGYKYLCTTEYGEKTERPHVHIIFLGLDFLTCRKIFSDSWPYGDVMILPVLDGGIRYVLKYIQEESFDEDQVAKYQSQGRMPPKFRVSQGMGFRWFYENEEQIKRDNCYYWHQKAKPIPTYIRNMWRLPPNTELVYNNMLRTQRQYKCDNPFDAEFYVRFARESLLIHQARDKGRAVYDYRDWIINRNLQKRRENPFVRKIIDLLEV